VRAQVARLETAAAFSIWQQAAMSQTPKQLWRHGQALTEYQVWVGYRIATRQLNLYHEDRGRDNSCRKLQSCQGVKETPEHIFWACPTARACWRKLTEHWMEERWTEQQVEQLQRQCASRTAPRLSEHTARRLKTDFPDEDEQVAKQWRRIWHIMSSVCVTSLWIQRNRVIFQHETITIEQSREEFWGTGSRQVQALAKRERRRPDTLLQGTWLLLCCEAFDEQPREKSTRKTGPVQPPSSKESPALLTRLRQYQASRS